MEVNQSVFTGYLFNQLALGNASVITLGNIARLNEEALDLYNKEYLDEVEIKSLKDIIMSCNILYNRTDTQKSF